MAFGKINGENISDISRINKIDTDAITKINDSIFNNVVRDNLVLWLEAGNEDSYSGSGNTWFDLSPTGYNFTNNGATITTVGGARCFSFDGINDYMIGPSTSRFGGDTDNSVGIWLNHASTPAFFDFIYGKEYIGNEWDPFMDHRDTAGSTGNGLGYGSFRASSPTINAWGSFNQTFSLNTWKYYTFTYDLTSTTSVTISFYVNGAFIGSSVQTFATGYFPATGQMTLATLKAFGTYLRYFHGRIGAVHAYNRVLSLDEINYNFNQNRGTYGI